MAAPALVQRFAQIIKTYGNDKPGYGNLTGLTVLSHDDEALYRRSFAAVRHGQFAKAEDLLKEVRDPLLAGHIRAEKYLSRQNQNKPNYTDMAVWLTKHNDLPQAGRIYASALKLKPQAASEPMAPAPQTLTKGALANTGSDLKIGIDSDTLDDADKPKAEAFNRLLRRGKLAEAEKLLERTRKDNKAPKMLAQAEAALAATAFFAGDDRRTKNLSASTIKTVPLAGWISGLRAWRLRDTAQASLYFSQFAEHRNLGDWDRAAGHFWHARALTRLGDVAGAHEALAKAAAYPHSFYGMLALAQTGQNIDFSWETPSLTSGGLRAIAAAPAGRRGLALLQVNEPELAMAELLRIRTKGNRELTQALVALAHEAGLPAFSLALGSALKTADGKLFDSALYPLPPWQPRSEQAEDHALIYAVARHESGFDPEAISRRGAQGLMQLMPRTAGGMTDAAMRGRNVNLFDPDYNITLGARYIRHLADHPGIDNNLLLMVAAYNGGPGNIARWRRAATHGDDPLTFIETLPVHETRDYVENVLASYWMYRARMDQSQGSLRDLAAGKWPYFATPQQFEDRETESASLTQPAFKIASK
ncbi:MAG: lytic transglycosylase domain-containing protein [Alphaproteobacteria bacterium]